MSKKNEDALESFFRKAVKQSDSSFMEQDWLAMQKQLDEHPATGPMAGKRVVRMKLAVAAATIVALMAVYFLNVRPDQQKAAEDLPGKQPAATSVVTPDQSAETEEEPAADLLAAQSPSRQLSDPAGKSTDARELRRTTSDIQVPIAGAQTETSSRTEDAFYETPVNVTATARPVSGGEFALSRIPPVAFPWNYEKEVSLNLMSMIRRDLKATVPLAQAGDTVADQSRRKETPTTPRWSVTLAVAPDFSTTTLSRYTSPGRAFGVLIGYQLHERIAVNAGIIKSSKRYVGDGSDYKPPYGYWRARTNGVIPDRILGSCDIIEIPLIVQYSILQRNRSRIYAGAGVSTYIMSNEEYRYTFGQPNPGADQGWSGEGSTSSYPMAIGHLSVGYERNISTRLSVGIEPFLKAPFGGMGWSDIHLFTTGANVNFRYRLVRGSGWMNGGTTSN